jgi:hypothetical protein
MAARTTQLALLVDQLMPALRTKPPMLAGNVFAGRRGTGIGPLLILAICNFELVQWFIRFEQSSVFAKGHVRPKRTIRHA